MSYWKDSHKAVEKPLSQKLYLQWGVFSAPYNLQPFVVEKKKGTMVTAKNDSKVVTRNSSQFKVISTKSAKHDDKEVEPKVPRPSHPRRQM